MLETIQRYYSELIFEAENKDKWRDQNQRDRPIENILNKRKYDVKPQALAVKQKKCKLKYDNHPWLFWSYKLKIIRSIYDIASK